MFLDLYFGKKLFESIMDNTQIKNKFWGYFWRTALIIAGAMAVVALLVLALGAVMQGELFLCPPMLLVLLTAILVVSVVTPIVQFLLWRR